MPYYAPSVYYPVIANSHARVVRTTASLVREATVLVGSKRIYDFSEAGPVSDSNFPMDSDVMVLDENAHVATVNTNSSNVQFSRDYQNVAVTCAHYGLLKVTL
jgi:hypothetical protein